MLAKSAKTSCNLSQLALPGCDFAQFSSVLEYGLVVMAAHPPRMCCDNAWGFFEKTQHPFCSPVAENGLLSYFCSGPTPRIFPFTHLHCKFPPHHPYVSLDRPRCRLIPFRDDRPRYLVESQICQERRISPGHETVAILSKKTSPAMLRAWHRWFHPPTHVLFNYLGGEAGFSNHHVISFVCMKYKHLEM